MFGLKAVIFIERFIGASPPLITIVCHESKLLPIKGGFRGIQGDSGFLRIKNLVLNPFSHLFANNINKKICMLLLLFVLTFPIFKT
jgi:hypothetical protein